MFSAYEKISNGIYREVFGLDFEEFKSGQVFHHRPGITISQQDNMAEATNTINSAQLHYDAHYAEQTEWKHCLGVSTLTIQKIIGATWKTFARKDRITEFENIAMSQPVFGGDTLYAESEILSVADLKNDSCGELCVETRGLNQKGVVVTTIKYCIRIYKKGQHPYYGKMGLNDPLTEEKFSAYQTEEDGSFKEQVGIYYEDLLAGEIYEHAPSKIISPEEATQHALSSLEWNPKYIDREYYQRYFQQNTNADVPPYCPIAEAHLIGAVTALTTRTFGRVVANLGWTEIKLNREIFPNERITVKSTIVSKRESHSRPTQGIVNVIDHCYDDDGNVIISFKRTFLVYKKGQGPYAAAGY